MRILPEPKESDVPGEHPLLDPECADCGVTYPISLAFLEGKQAYDEAIRLQKEADQAEQGLLLYLGFARGDARGA